MEKAKYFEDLWIWKEARRLTKDVYSDFSTNTSGKSDYGFCNQIQRASISVMNNIAEGFERRTDVEFARFLDIAKGSCGEVRSMYYPAEDLGYVTTSLAEERRQNTRAMAAGITSLIAHLRHK